MANELQVLELKVEKITPASIVSNVDKLEPFIEKVKEKYGNLVFTEDEKATAKEMRTNLNKLEKQISDERKKIEKEAKVEIDNIINTLKKAEKDVKKFERMKAVGQNAGKEEQQRSGKLRKEDKGITLQQPSPCLRRKDGAKRQVAQVDGRQEREEEQEGVEDDGKIVFVQDKPSRLFAYVWFCGIIR